MAVSVRVKVDADGPGGSGWTYTYWAYDSANPVLQFDGNTSTVPSHRYTWGPAVDQILADEVVDNGGDEDMLYPLTDWQGTVRDLATYDDVNGTQIQNHKIYNAFGKVTHETNAAVDTIFGYTGRYFDDHTDLQWNLNRWYDPEIGRWLSEDPINFEGGDANLYRYVGNSPTNATDATGLSGKTVDAGCKGITFFIEWFPGRNTGEIAIIGRKGVQLARVKWILNPQTGELVANVVGKHGGKLLPGVAQSTLRKIMPKLSQEMARNVQRVGGAGGRWVLTRLADPSRTGGRLGLARTAGTAGRMGVGTVFAVVAAFFSLENTCQAGEVAKPEVMQIDPEALGLTREEVAAIVEALEGELPDDIRAFLDEE